MKIVTFAILALITPNISFGVSVEEFTNGSRLFASAVYQEVAKTGKKNILDHYRINETFRVEASEFYFSELGHVNFVSKYKTAHSINQWVKRQTRYRIQTMIDPETLKADTVAILVNALYFKAWWVQRFSSTDTRKRSFHKTTHDAVQIDFMYSDAFEDPFNYYESRELEAQFLEIPFRGGAASMVFVLPDTIDGITRLEDRMNEVLAPKPFRRALVDVTIPKFTTKTTNNFQEILQKMGVKKAFQKSVADFSGIGGQKGDIFISDVMQNCIIKVQEVGIDLAAVSFIRSYSTIDTGEFKKNFVADHPFIYYIKAHDVILVVGRLTDPK
ncbi:antichymotrypsin-2-like isoform X2 [Tenebrio molitor]|uniref:antichymotrypsin-2-like isoform X2 n=1 Tax=Tenebrio molitor TaxID=7067 RepID=UPI00362491F1